MRMFKKEEGFTLVELMVVVLIIGILVAIAIPVFNAAQDSARKSACQNNLRVLDGATQQWVAADPDNDASLITTMDLAKAFLGTDATQPVNASGVQGAADATHIYTAGQYVKDWAGSSACPDGAVVYSVTEGDFYCTVDAEHNYDDQGAPAAATP